MWCNCIANFWAFFPLLPNNGMACKWPKVPRCMTWHRLIILIELGQLNERSLFWLGLNALALRPSWAHFILYYFFFPFSSHTPLLFTLALYILLFWKLIWQSKYNWYLFSSIEDLSLLTAYLMCMLNLGWRWGGRSVVSHMIEGFFRSTD